MLWGRKFTLGMLHTLGTQDCFGDATYPGDDRYLGNNRYLLHTTAAPRAHNCTFVFTLIHSFMEHCVPAQMKATF